MSQVTIVAGTLADVEFLAQAMYLGSHPAPPADIPAPPNWMAGVREETRNQVQGLVPDGTTYIIRFGAVRVGRLRVVRNPERLFLAGIQVIPEFRNKGIGTYVITTLLQEVRRLHLPLELTVSKDNPDAERLYVQLGFERIGEDGSDYLMVAR